MFLCEYAGPLLVYPIFYLRPSIIYGVEARRPIEQVVTIALLCHSFHYAKRLFETQYIHRFSNATMPITNLFKVGMLLSESLAQPFSKPDCLRTVAITGASQPSCPISSITRCTLVLPSRQCKCGWDWPDSSSANSVLHNCPKPCAYKHFVLI